MHIKPLKKTYSALRETQTIINILLNDIGPIVRRQTIKNNLKRLCDTQRQKHSDAGTADRHISCMGTREERRDAAKRPRDDWWLRINNLRNTANDIET